MLVLGIETSCDETAAAIVRGQDVLSDVVHSQVSLHAEYGGVVPELASRDHLTNVEPVLRRALADAGVTLGDLDAIAVTTQPGLSGALLVGTQVARALSWSRGLPLVAVDHLVGHLLAAFLRFPGEEAEAPSGFPFIGLLASGGHTAVYRVDGPTAESMIELGGTRDDAAGEAFDKVSKLLGLGYPGGPIIDRLAREGDPNGVDLPRPMQGQDTLDLSFSGLKTNVAAWVRAAGPLENDQRLRDLCAAFQRRVVDSLLDRAFAAAEREGIDTVVLAGGVAANRELRERGRSEAAKRGLLLIAPCRRASTDNAAMIAYAGSILAARGQNDLDTLAISPKTRLPRKTHKGGGKR